MASISILTRAQESQNPLLYCPLHISRIVHLTFIWQIAGDINARNQTGFSKLTDTLLAICLKDWMIWDQKIVEFEELTSRYRLKIMSRTYILLVHALNFHVICCHVIIIFFLKTFTLYTIISLFYSSLFI